MLLLLVRQAGHLLPLERPQEIARLIVEFDRGSEQHDGADGSPDPDYASLIASDRVSARTRAVLRARGSPTDDERGVRSLSAELLGILRAVLGRVIPQPEHYSFDLATTIDADLAAGPGDGWRFACLPPDADAHEAALRTLDIVASAAHGRPFAVLGAEDQDGLLERAASGDLAVDREAASGFTLSAAQMKLWFEYVRADAVKSYVAHPATLARMGYSGIANGGDGTRKQGFVQVGVGEREPWEPRSRGHAS